MLQASLTSNAQKPPAETLTRLHVSVPKWMFHIYTLYVLYIYVNVTYFVSDDQLKLVVRLSAICSQCWWVGKQLPTQTHTHRSCGYLLSTKYIIYLSTRDDTIINPSINPAVMYRNVFHDVLQRSSPSRGRFPHSRHDSVLHGSSNTSILHCVTTLWCAAELWLGTSSDAKCGLILMTDAKRFSKEGWARACDC